MTLSIGVDASRCIHCGACAALCPGVFEVTVASSSAVRPPLASERGFVDAARWICPVDAVRLAREDDRVAEPVGSRNQLLFRELAIGAERVRWALDAVPWQDVEPKRASTRLRSVVREMALSENATYSATQRFLESFFDEYDFSRWISVWFYEETRHSQLLLEWLHRVGEYVSTDVVVKGRVSAPFMRSVVGTLVTNVISEVTAAQAYRHLARISDEPVLGRIARLIAGDEARHAASFFRFASKELATLTHEVARRERARGLEVLQAWLGGARPATHPVAQTMQRLEGGADRDSLDLDFAAIRTRVIRVVGLLLDLPLHREDDVAPVLRELLSKGRAAAEREP
jgi:ferredoxin